MTIIVNSLAIGYDKVGNGSKVVVLLHGWGANRKSLDALALALQERFTVVNIDVPGFGDSERPHEVWGFGEYASWLSNCLKKLELDNVYALVGHSNGGAIAIKAVSSGLEVQKLVLLGASGVRNREKGKKIFLKSISKTGKVATALLPGSMRKKVRGKWYKTIGSELYDTPGMEEFFKKVTSEDLLVDAAMIGIPTLLIYGSEDRATPPVDGEMYQRVIENSSLHIIEGAGHYSFIDNPNQVNSLISGFLK